MRDVGVGRVLAASLHQGIADVLPTRLGFYENWLSAEALRDGTIGVAPLSAVLSFLRQEGEAYDQIMTRAGEYAADWTVESMRPLTRSLVSGAPAWMRQRLALRAAARIVRSSFDGSRAVVRIRRGMARVDLRGSIFCGVREPVTQPLCGFYAATFSRMLATFNLPAHPVISGCRATDPALPGCVLSAPLGANADGENRR